MCDGTSEIVCVVYRIDIAIRHDVCARDTPCTRSSTYLTTAIGGSRTDAISYARRNDPWRPLLLTSSLPLTSGRADHVGIELSRFNGFRSVRRRPRLALVGHHVRGHARDHAPGHVVRRLFEPGEWLRAKSEVEVRQGRLLAAAGGEKNSPEVQSGTSVT